MWQINVIGRRQWFISGLGQQHRWARLDRQFWRSQISTPVKLKLYCAFCGFSCTARRAGQTPKRCTDVLDLLMVVKHQVAPVHYYCSVDVRWITQQPALTLTIQARHLSLFGYIARMDDSTASSSDTAIPVASVVLILCIVCQQNCFSESLGKPDTSLIQYSDQQQQQTDKMLCG